VGRERVEEVKWKEKGRDGVGEEWGGEGLKEKSGEGKGGGKRWRERVRRKKRGGKV